MKLRNIHHVPKRTPGWQQPETEQKKFTSPSSIPPSWQRSIDRHKVNDPIARHHSLILTDTGRPLPKKTEPIFPTVTEEKNPTAESQGKSPQVPVEPSFWQRGLTTGFLTLSQLLAVAGPAITMTSPSAVIAQEEKLPVPKEINIPKELDRIAREKIVIQFAEEAWAQIKPALKDFKEGKNLAAILKERPTLGQAYCNLLVALHVSDDTGVDIDRIRSELMEESPKNTIIPFEIVHGLLHTNQVLVNVLHKRIEKTSNEAEKIKLRERIKVIVKGSERFLGKTIVDLKDKRYSLSRAEAEEFKNKNSEATVYTNEDFPKLAARLIGTAAIPELIQSATEGYRTFGNDKNTRDSLLQIFLTMKPGTVPTEVLEISARNIFGAASMAEHEKVMKEKTKTGKLPDLSTTIPTGSSPSKNSTPPKTGSLEELKNVQVTFPNELVLSPKLPNYQSLDAKDKLFLGEVILLFAREGNEYILPAAAQYFSIQHPSEGAKADLEASATDFNVLEALARYTHESKSPAAFEALKRITASFPKLVLGDTLLSGSITTRYTPKGEAGKEFIKVCRTFPKETQDFIRVLAEQRAALLCSNQPAQEEDQRTLNSTRELHKQYALAVMAFLDTEKVFVGDLRKRIEPGLGLTKEKEWTVAIYGLVNAKDEQSINRLLELGLDETKDNASRRFVLEAILQIDKNDFLPEEVYKMTRGSHNFGTNHLQGLAYKDAKTGEWTSLASNPENLLQEGLVQKLVEANYAFWLASENKANEIAVREGQVPRNISDTTKMGKALEYINTQFEMGGDRGVLALRAKDPSFKAKYLLPMIKYIKNASEEKPIDTELALVIMRILSKAQCQEAMELMADIATNTKKYSLEEKQHEIYRINIRTSGIATLRATAIKFLGNTIDLKDTNPNSKGAYELHRMSYSASSLYREASLTGLEFLRRRYENELSKAITDEERKVLLEVRRAHGLKVFENLTRLQRGEEPSITLSSDSELEIGMARFADALGATKEVLLQVLKKERQNLKHPFVYNGLIALALNDRKEEEIKSLGFSDEVAEKVTRLYKNVVDKEYYKGKNFPKLSKPIEIAIEDVAYIPRVHQIKGLKELRYPQELCPTSQGFLEPHPLAVLSAIGDLVGYENLSVLSLNVNGNAPEVPFRTPQVKYTALQTFEHLTQELITGSNNIKYVNRSYGFSISNDSNEGARIFQISRAYLNLQHRLGVLHFVAAGNSRTDSSFGPFGSLNPLGYGIDRKGNTDLFPIGGISVSAYHGFTGKQASFTSIGNELDPKSSPVTWHFPGVNEKGVYAEHGKHGYTPWSGTSCASPNALAIISICEEQRTEKGLPKFTNAQRRAALDNATRPLPGQASNERGRVVPEELLKQYLMPEPQIASREKK